MGAIASGGIRVLNEDVVGAIGLDEATIDAVERDERRELERREHAYREGRPPPEIAGRVVILADDGLQHYRLRRSVEIAVVDAARALGNGWLLPAGPLREPASRLRAVDAVVVLTMEGAHTVPPELRGAFTMLLVGDRFARVDDPLTTLPASAFAREGVHALAGIGHPARFFAQLAAMGIAATPHPFPDHHRFVPDDLAIADAQAILMTEKDALKCESFADERCWYLPVRARIDEALVNLVEGKLRGSQAA